MFNLNFYVFNLKALLYFINLRDTRGDADNKLKCFD